jgi:hypothetical protein
MNPRRRLDVEARRAQLNANAR